MDKLLCSYCKKTFSRQSCLTKHINSICPVLRTELTVKCSELEIDNKKLKNIIDEQKQTIAALREENASLKEQFELKIELARKDAKLEVSERRVEKLENHILKENSKPRTSNVTLNIAPYNFSADQIQEICNQYTVDDLNSGPEATYEFITEKHLKDPDGRPRLKCTDAARKTFITIKEDGTKEVDVGGQKIVKALRKPMQRAVIKACDSISEITDQQFREKLAPHHRALEPSRLTRRLSADFK